MNLTFFDYSIYLLYNIFLYTSINICVYLSFLFSIFHNVSKSFYIYQYILSSDLLHVYTFFISLDTVF